MSWRETRQPDVTSDGDRITTVRRYFTVWGFSPAMVRATPTLVLNEDGEGLPPYRDDFGGGVLLRRYNTSSDGLVFDVQADYATNEADVLPPPNLDYAWEGSWQTETFDFPCAKYARTLVPTPPDPDADPFTPPPAPTAIYDWEFITQPVFYTAVRHSRKVKVTANLSTAIDIISDQANKLQKIAGRWYVFRASDYRQRTAQTFETTYTFEYDPGVAEVLSPLPGNGPSPPLGSFFVPTTRWMFLYGGTLRPTRVDPQNPPQFGTPVFLRPPFCNLVLVRGVRPPAPPPEPGAPPVPEPPVYPEEHAFCPYSISQTIGDMPGQGWTLLPGVLGP